MEKKIVPNLINFRGSVPIPINRGVAEIGAVQTTISEKKYKVWTEIGAILVNHFGNKRKTRIAWILIGILFLGAGPLVAAETVKKESTLKQTASIEKRGVVNFLTAPAELVYAFKGEKKDHPKAWPLTYVPRFFTNTVIRVGSSVNDILVLPWYAAASNATPLTRRFELPDYVWEEE